MIFDGAYIGASAVSKVYLGGVVIWSESGTSPTSPPSFTVEFDITTGNAARQHRVDLSLTSGGGILQTATLSAGDNSHNFTSVDFNTQYRVSIVALDGATESNALVVDIYSRPENSPSIFAAAASGQNAVNLSWTNTSAGGTLIERSANGSTGWAPLATVAGGVTTYANTGLTGSSTYYYRARHWRDNPAPHGDAYSGYSAVVNATTAADTSVPLLSSVSVTPGNTTAALAATSNEDSTMYWFVGTSVTQPGKAALKAGTGAAYAFNEACSAGVASTQTATGLTNGTTYYLHALTSDGTNDSAISTTAGFVPAVPSGTAFITTPTAGTNRNDYTAYLGFVISVPATITVTDLGRMWRTGNTGSHNVGIFNSSGSPMVIAAVNCATGTNGVFNYTSVAATVLTAGTYYVASLETDGGDTWGDLSTQGATTAAASIYGQAYRAGTGTYGSFVDGAATNSCYSNPNFKYT